MSINIPTFEELKQDPALLETTIIRLLGKELLATSTIALRLGFMVEDKPVIKALERLKKRKIIYLRPPDPMISDQAFGLWNLHIC